MFFLPLAIFLSALAVPIGQSLPAQGAIAPRPSGNSTQWIGIGDYPQEAIVQKQSGRVGFSLQVAADGDVTGCRIDRSSGASSLDRATCILLFERAHFLPATNGAGSPVAGTYSSAVTWVYPTKIEGQPDIKPVNLPGLRRSGELSSVLLVNADGKIASCRAGNAPSDYVVGNPNMCALFPVGARYAPPATEKGKPVKRKVTLDLSVTDVNVR